MYENVITNIKKQKNNSLFIVLGISLLLLFIAFGLNIAKHFKNTKQAKQTQKPAVTKQQESKTNLPTQATISGSNGVINVYVPAGFPIAYPGTQLNLILPNKQTLIFVAQSKPTICPETKVVEKEVEEKAVIPKKSVKSTETHESIVSQPETSSANSSSFSSSNNGTSTQSTSTSTSGPNATASATAN